ncbi:MAG: DinB family protein [Planctomycetes bacterium]|nr:DinB family protein [Planctomycetota bacterium]
MNDHFKNVLSAQYEATLCMLNDCIVKCPAEHWEGVIAKYPFWQVVYHTLCCTDIYLTPGGEAAFKPHPVFHPKGMEDIRGEYPSRRFSREELLAYLAFCREKMASTMAQETQASMEAPTKFPWLTMSQSEMHIYNIRHVQHHAGQLGAFLRRQGGELRWVKRGWVPL